MKCVFVVEKKLLCKWKCGDSVEILLRRGEPDR